MVDEILKSIEQRVCRAKKEVDAVYRWIDFKEKQREVFKKNQKKKINRNGKFTEEENNIRRGLNKI